MNDVSVQVSNVSLRYLITQQKPRSLQEFFINLVKGRMNERMEFWALNEVSFTLNRGESLGLIGLNGAGKSTLLKAIAGVFNPTQGEIKTYGMVAPLIELGAGFDPELSGCENVYLNAAILGLTKREIEKRLPEILEFSGLKEFITAPLKTYSTGMMARLAFSVATAVDPDILIIDEVLAVGDSRFSKKCYDLIDSFLAKGVSLIFVSHDMGQVKRLCKKTIWLEGGWIKKMGETEEVVAAYLNGSNGT